VVLNDTSYVEIGKPVGPVNTITFNDNSFNNGIILGGTVIFNDNSINNGILVAPELIFNDASINTYVSTANSNEQAKADIISINGKPIATPFVFDVNTMNLFNCGENKILCPVFNRAKLGVNGSNLLGIL
jgi:hypothetical protein